MVVIRVPELTARTRVVTWVLGGAGALLPFDDGLPILGLFFIELFFPFFLRFFTVTTVMPAFVASSAVVALDVVIQVALGLGGYFIAVDDGVKVRSFQTVREFGGLFMIRSTGQARSVRFGVGFVVYGTGFVPWDLCWCGFWFSPFSLWQV